MALVQSQIFGLMKPSPRITARNAHLIPEIYLRAKRILHSAKEEMVMANSVVRRMAELWTKMKTGAKCTCSQELDKDREQTNCNCKGTPDLAEFLQTGNLRILDRKEFCPICWGSGKVGGYNLSGTTSVILHADNVTELHGGVSLLQGTPYTIRVGTQGSITWEIDFPRYFLNAHTIVMYWNKIPENYSLYIDDEPFNIDVFNTLGQIPRKDKVKITLEVEDTSGIVEFYYLRFFLKISRNTLVSVDIPNFTYSHTGELQIHDEINSTVTINFDGQQKIETYDIIMLEDDGIGFRIIENEFINPMGVTISNNCQGRLIRSFENYYLMPSKIGLKTYPSLLDHYIFLY